MNRFVVVCAVCITSLLAGCQEAKDLNNPISEKDVYKKIGEEIPFETGMEWIAYHRARNRDDARTESVSPYYVPATQMNLLLGSVADLVGVAFHYAIDETGVTHILVIPVDMSLGVWSLVAGKIIIDANTGSAITPATASLWAGNYKAIKPESVWFHFFGKDIFDEMRALPYYNGVDIEPATNSTDLTPEMLLVIWNEQATSTGRTQASNATVYDASNACPPCAAE